ncbi:Response regulator receiver domain-containing protein [Tindallia magadiensis]|uniref:Stage 0 sporulation protein A homolog n=1 Tax=Tindallia magadiensis TaxID=69895 RepID=A0A1I3HA99_9FIRM|nr:HDOD domain-containing protein [Tindallia magadiensis]SFI32480.1 Response regulator receiver domain-containing protein [Tindallia magadiensis]
MNRSILIVDDEQQVLRSLERLFLPTDYHILTAPGGHEALQLLEKTAVDMIISDMRMPGMNGYDLLSTVKTKYPHIVRIMLSGYSEEKVVMKALLDNTVKVYLFKPWNNQEMLDTISQIFETCHLLNNPQLMQLINKSSYLSTIEDTYRKIEKSIESEADIAKIAAIIEKDSVVTGEILRLANSVYIGARTGSLQTAITYIGLDHVKQMIRSTSILKLFLSSKKHRFLLNRLWKKSALSQQLYLNLHKYLLDKPVPDNCFSAALLHNIGIMFLLMQFEEPYAQLLLESEKNPEKTTELEMQLCGNSYEEVSGYLLNWWNLPFSVVEAALYHRIPFDERVINKEVAALVHLSRHYACQRLGFTEIEELDPRVFDYFGVDAPTIEDHISHIDLEDLT